MSEHIPDADTQAAAAHLDGLAWSADEVDGPIYLVGATADDEALERLYRPARHRPWWVALSAATGIAATGVMVAIVLCGVLIAGGAVQPASAPVTPSAASVPTVTLTAPAPEPVTQTVTAAAPRPLKTADPAPVSRVVVIPGLAPVTIPQLAPTPAPAYVPQGPYTPYPGDPEHVCIDGRGMPVPLYQVGGGQAC